MSLFKTTIVIWSDTDPSNVELIPLAEDAVTGGSYCSKQDTVVIEDPTEDPEWDGTEFFILPDS